jgi:integrase
MTVSDAFTIYKQDHPKLSTATIRVYDWTLNKHLSDWTKRPLSSITLEMIKVKHRAIAIEAAKTNKKHENSRHRVRDLTGATAANLAIRVLATVWAYAHSEHAAPPCPMTGRKFGWLETTDSSESFLRDAELANFFRAVSALPSPLHRDQLVLALFTGLRRANVLGLRWEEVDLQERTLTFSAARMKSHRPFVLPISQYVTDVLIARRSLGVDGNGFVFPSSRNNTHAAAPDAALYGINVEQSLRLSLHSLRKSYASVAAKAGVPRFAISRLLDHSSGEGGAAITDSYVFAETEALRPWVEKISDRLCELCQITKPQGENVRAIR